MVSNKHPVEISGKIYFRVVYFLCESTTKLGQSYSAAASENRVLSLTFLYNKIFN